MRLTTLLAALLLMPLAGMAANRLYIEDFSIAPGETREVSLLLDNDEAWAGIGVDIELPEGLDIETNARGLPVVTLNSERATDHMTTTNIRSNGMVAIAVFTFNATALVGNSGAVLTFNVTAASDFTGTHTIGVRNVELVDANGGSHMMDDTDCVVTAAGGNEAVEGMAISPRMCKLKPGESVQLTALGNAAAQGVTWVSEDESVATVDEDGLLTAMGGGMVAITARAPSGESAWCAVFVAVQGDVDDDGKMTIDDVTTLIDLLLGCN